jgi:hypothetical protein
MENILISAYIVWGPISPFEWATLLLMATAIVVQVIAIVVQLFDSWLDRKK